MWDDFLLKQLLISIVLFFLFANGVRSILYFFDKKNTFISKVKSDFCNTIKTKPRRIGAVISIFISGIVFAMFYKFAPISVGVITGSFYGIVAFFKESDLEKNRSND